MTALNADLGFYGGENVWDEGLLWDGLYIYDKSVGALTSLTLLF